MGGSSVGFTVRHVDAVRQARALQFHLQHATKFLWPRTEEQFRKLVEDACLFAAYADDGDICAIAYLATSEHSDTYELGGIFATPACRGKGVADALVKVALAVVLAMDTPPPGAEIIAHVHKDNPDPRKLLRRNGFEHNGREERVPDHIAPPLMPRDPVDNCAVGHVFELDCASLHGVADWLSAGCGGFCVEVGPIADTLDDVVEVLRWLADGRP